MENQKKYTGRRVGAGLIAALITILMIAEGLMLSLKIGVFKKTTISGLFEEMDVYDDLRDVVSDIIQSGDGSGSIGIAGLDNLDTSKIISNTMMNDIVGLIEESVKSGKKADLSKVIEKHKDAIVSNFCEQAVDRAMGDVGNIVSKEKLDAIGWISDMSKQYNLDLSKEIMDCIKEDYELNENGELDLSKIDKKELANKIASSLKKEASDKIDEELEKYLNDLNDSLNNVLGPTSSIEVPDREGVVYAGIVGTASAGCAVRLKQTPAPGRLVAGKDMSIGDIMRKATGALDLMSKLIVIFAVLIVVLIAAEILLYVKIGMGWLKNLSICCLVTGIVHMIVFFVVNGVKSSLLKADFGIDSAAVKDLITKVINKCMGGLLGVVITIGITLTVIGAAALAVYIVVNKKSKKKETEIPAAAA